MLLFRQWKIVFKLNESWKCKARGCARAHGEKCLETDGGHVRYCNNISRRTNERVWRVEWNFSQRRGGLIICKTRETGRVYSGFIYIYARAESAVDIAFRWFVPYYGRIKAPLSRTGSVSERITHARIIIEQRAFTCAYVSLDRFCFLQTVYSCAKC